MAYPRDTMLREIAQGGCLVSNHEVLVGRAEVLSVAVVC
jgi:hypothetical protein